MTEYLTEQEQIQQLKKIARQYIPAVLIGLALAFILSSGWHVIQNYQNKIRIQASAIYEDMLTFDDQNNTKKVVSAAQTLLAKYPHTVYANMAALMLARDAVVHNNVADAEKNLNKILKKGKKSGLYSLARIRLARIKLSQGEADAALKLLDSGIDIAFNGLINTVRGDALIYKHDAQAARKAYGLALTQLPKSSLLNSILQMKLDNLSSATGNRT